ncbi:MAG: hypothetical protein HY779_01045, partial [Rubrobacteridae bacterium]|nr:hypothetical protein [Rubrobacteridae bacterium]
LPTPETILGETCESLLERLESGMQMLIDKGIDKEVILKQALITPSCGTGPMKPENAERTFLLTKQVSEEMRKKHFGL